MHERGTGTIEWVGLAAAVSLLLAGVAAGMRGGPGGAVGAQVAERLQAAVTATDTSTRSAGTRRVVHERRVSGGSDPQRVPRDQLRLTPIIDPIAWWHREITRPVTLPGTHGVFDGRACALCIAVEGSHTLRSGANHDHGVGQLGGELDVTGEVRLALASVDAELRLGQQAGPLQVEEQGRVRGIIGATTELRGRLQLAPSEQDVELRGTAMAGASARAEGRIGAQLLGISVVQAGRAEGWAGAGARGAVGVHRTPDRVDWRVGWGLALGLGGAAEWSGSIDVSNVPHRYHRLATTVLAAGVNSLTSALPFPARLATLDR